MCDDCRELQEKIKELEESEERLYNYFAKWFEEERLIFDDEFYEWWNSIKTGKIK